MDKIKPFEAVVRFEPTSNVRVNGGVHTCRCDEVIVQQLVRCKDCKHWDSDGDDMCHCSRIDYWTNANFFCADGERKEQNDEE